MCVCVRARVCMYTHWIFLTLLMLLVSSLDILDCCGHKRATWGIRNKLRLESAGCSLLNSDWLVRPPLFLCCVGCSTNHLLFPVPGRRGTREEGRGFQRAVPWGVMGQRSRKRIGTLGPLRGWGFFSPSFPPTFAPIRLTTCLVGTRDVSVHIALIWLAVETLPRVEPGLKDGGQLTHEPFPLRRYYKKLDFSPWWLQNDRWACRALKQEWGTVHSQTARPALLMHSAATEERPRCGWNISGKGY